MCGHPIFSSPSFCQITNHLGKDCTSGLDQKVMMDAVFNPLLPQPKRDGNYKFKNSPTPEHCVCTELWMDGEGTADANRPTLVPKQQQQQQQQPPPLSKKGIFCVPEEDSGLLFGSC